MPYRISQEDVSAILAVIGKIADDAYHRGEEDAAARIMAAARNVGAPIPANAPESIRETIVQVSADHRDAAAAPRRRAAKGSVPRYVTEVLTDPAYTGTDYAGIARRIAELGGNGIALASIRNRLRQMELEGNAVREGDIWRLTDKGREAARAEKRAAHPMLNS